jgi:hypothetical protein
MTLGKTLLELANKGYDIRFVYGPIDPDPFYSDAVAMIISKGVWHQRINLDLREARQLDDAGVDACLESALEQGAKKIMEVI